MTDATPTAAKTLSQETVGAYREYGQRHSHDRYQRVMTLAEMVVTLADALDSERAHAAQAVAAETERCAQIARDCHALHGPGDGRIAASWIETVILHARAGQPGQETT